MIVSLVGLGGGLAGVKEGPIGERGGSYNRQAWGVPIQKVGVKNGYKFRDACLLSENPDRSVFVGRVQSWLAAGIVPADGIL
ncbi:MAG: hypothetical protein QGH07_16075 [Alphaproteobacteria bacterium]|nr:hypothetical protein [Alphaproteobacteria bacterium]MEC8199531.1 hypothetical protein [Pseudomonadota bacterium]